MTFSGKNPAALVRYGTFADTLSGNTIGGPFPAQVWGQAVTTYDFNLTTSPLGYDITLIQAYSAWGDRVGQSYRIYCAQVGSSSTFLQFGGDIVATTAGKESIITRSEDSAPGAAILSNVSSIRFVQFEGPGGFDGIDSLPRTRRSGLYHDS